MSSKMYKDYVYIICVWNCLVLELQKILILVADARTIYVLLLNWKD